MSKNEEPQVLNRISEEEVLSYAHRVWPDQQSMAIRVASEALTVIRETCQINPMLFRRKSGKGIVGGLFYLLGYRCGSIKTQREIARSLNTTEITIGASCRAWMKPFQDYLRHRNRQQRDKSMNRRSLRKLG
jgi:transcription initiation factor TFIIIB Brf1 subunit/transcription initiation factor TFIIB